MPKWPYDLPYERLDLRDHPELYRIGIGEQGVLTVQPYKRELLPYWRFSTPDKARISSQKLKACFDKYRDDGDFVGCDMARKFIQMGVRLRSQRRIPHVLKEAQVTRARRYANRAGGKKYEKQSAEDKAAGKKRKMLPKAEVEDPIKAESARIFAVVLAEVKADPTYLEMTARHKSQYEKEPIPEADNLEPFLLVDTASDTVKKEEEDSAVKAESP